MNILYLSLLKTIKHNEMEDIINELENDIYNCKINGGDAGDNTDEIDEAINTLNKLKALVL